MAHKLGVVILAAGLGKRMKAYGPKSAIGISSDQTVIGRQISIIQSCFPKYEITVIVGFQKDKVLEKIPSLISYIENKSYESTNTSMSVNLALSRNNYSKLLIIYGDLVFTDDIFKEMPKNNSWIAIDNEKNQRSMEVGVNVVDNNVVHFSYGISPKWGHIAMLTGNELLLYKKITNNERSHKKFCFEIFNEIIDHSGIFKAHRNNNWKMVEIDTSKDIDRAKKLVKRG